MFPCCAPALPTPAPALFGSGPGCPGYWWFVSLSPPPPAPAVSGPGLWFPWPRRSSRLFSSCPPPTPPAPALCVSASGCPGPWRVVSVLPPPPLGPGLVWFRPRVSWALAPWWAVALLCPPPPPIGELPSCFVACGCSASCCVVCVVPCCRGLLCAVLLFLLRCCNATLEHYARRAAGPSGAMDPATPISTR